MCSTSVKTPDYSPWFSARNCLRQERVSSPLYECVLFMAGCSIYCIASFRLTWWVGPFSANEVRVLARLKSVTYVHTQNNKTIVDLLSPKSCYQTETHANLCVVAASKKGLLTQVSTTADAVHGISFRVRVILVVVETHNVLHAGHIFHLYIATGI